MAVIIIHHTICPVYDYPEPTQFTGNNYFNPYSEITSMKKIKANFHAHTRVWGGLTDGKNNIKEDVIERYRHLKYDLAGISDYMSINTYQQNDPLFIPEYEHGIGIKKNHQLSIGAKSVLWNDYIFFQTIDNEQTIIKQLKDRSELVCIAHPKLRNAYTAYDFERLTDYDCIEIVNHNFGKALDMWDAALSSGHLVFGMGDDDCHLFDNPNEFGGGYNIIYGNALSGEEVIKSLKTGKSFTVDQTGSTLDIKRQRAIDLPSLINYSVDSGKINITLDKQAHEIRFIGQNGVQEDSGKDVSKMSYPIKAQDTYIRAEIIFPDSTTFYLNPVVRYTGNEIQNPSVVINWTKTWLLRSITGLIFILILSLIALHKKKEIKL